MLSAPAVICGAGIAGVATAYHLAVEHGISEVVLVDERPPLTLTSDKSTEAYRNWWAGPDGALVQLMNRSIDWLERWADEDGNRIRLNRRGYVYATAVPETAAALQREGERAAAFGAGALRVHDNGASSYRPAPGEGYRDQPDGADLLLDRALIHEHFPYLNEQAIALLHARRCGWFSGQQLGQSLLEKARAAGTRLVAGRVMGVEVAHGRVQGVRLANGDRLATDCFVNAAGPFLRDVGRLVGVDLPVYSERHYKAAIRDHLGIIPRDAPMLIWQDEVLLPWPAEERAALAADPATRWLTEPLPAGAHLRPEGAGDSQTVLLIWGYETEPVPERLPLPPAPDFPEIALRGVTALVPGLAGYLDRLPRPYVDGGYYTKTAENRLLASPVPGVDGAYVIGALSGYGLMASAAAGELVAAHITGAPLPAYAPAFHLARYDEPGYRERFAAAGSAGQL